MATLILLAPVPASADWTAGAYLGGARTAPSALSIVQSIHDTDIVLARASWRGRSFEFPVYYGARVGRTLPWRVLAVEAEFIHAKVYADTDRAVTTEGRRNGIVVDAVEPMSRSVEAFAISHGLNLIFVNLIARVPIGSPASRLAFAARGGAGPTVPHTESTIGGVHRQGYQLGSIAVQAAAGVEIRLAGSLCAVGEYKFTRTHQTVAVAEGEASVLLRTHHGVFGVEYRF
jgi:hypothetical protein